MAEATTPTTDPKPSSNRSRGALVVAASTVALLILAGILVDQNTRPTLISGPMVQIPEPGVLAIVWHMETPFARGAVRLTGPGDVELVAEATEANGRYVATFSDLPPDRAYRYVVLNDGFLGREIPVAGPYDTAAATSRGEPFRFVAFGDSGVGSHSQAALAELIADAKPAVVIHTGDLVYTVGAAEDYLLNFFQPNERLIRSVPFMPSLGNHDCATEFGQPYLDAFELPENGPPGIPLERHYWFDFGDARFVALDSDKVAEKHSGVLTPEQMKTVVAPWLREVLTNCDARWKFVYFHHPFYTGCGTHSPDGAAYVKEAYVDVLEDCGVDIVFAGHNHLYERTAPILRDKIVEAGQGGVVYVTTGAGGASRYPMDEDPPDYIVAYNDEFLSFTQVDLSANTLHLKQISDRGLVLDEYVIEKTPAELADNDG